MGLGDFWGSWPGLDLPSGGGVGAEGFGDFSDFVDGEGDAAVAQAVAGELRGLFFWSFGAQLVG